MHDYIGTYPTIDAAKAEYERLRVADQSQRVNAGNIAACHEDTVRLLMCRPCGVRQYEDQDVGWYDVDEWGPPLEERLVDPQR